jgi:hypothetical protein
MSPYSLRAQKCYGGNKVKIGRIEISGHGVLLGSLTACLVLTVLAMGEGARLFGQIVENKWVASNPPKVVEALLAADKMAPMSVASFEGRMAGSPVAKNLKAKSMFPGVEIKDGQNIINAKVPKLKGGQKNLFPKFAQKKTRDGVKLVGRGGTKFKTPRGKKPAVTVGPDFTKKKARSGAQRGGGLYKIIEDSPGASVNRNSKLVFPKSKLAKFKSSIRSAKAKGAGDAKIAFPGSVKNKPAKFTKKARFERGQATEFKIKKQTSN